MEDTFEEFCSRHHPMNKRKQDNFTKRKITELKRRTLGFCGTSSRKSLEEMATILEKMGFLDEKPEKRLEAAKNIITTYLLDAKLSYKTRLNPFLPKREIFLAINTEENGKYYQISLHPGLGYLPSYSS